MIVIIIVVVIMTNIQNITNGTWKIRQGKGSWKHFLGFRWCQLDDSAGVMRGHRVVGEQGVQEGAKHTLLRDPMLSVSVA